MKISKLKKWIIVMGITLVCCFTPVLVLILGLLGLSFISASPFLDYFLYAMVAISIGFIIYHSIKNKKNMEKANLTCPKCKYKQEIVIPQTGCQAFYKCNSCGEIISVPKDSKNCCVICEYSDKRCPVAKPIDKNNCQC